MIDFAYLATNSLCSLYSLIPRGPTTSLILKFNRNNSRERPEIPFQPISPRCLEDHGKDCLQLIQIFMGGSDEQWALGEPGPSMDGEVISHIWKIGLGF